MVYRYIFKKIAQFHLRVWLPIISKFYNWYFARKCGIEKLNEAIIERERIISLGNFISIKQFIQSKYEWVSDPLKGTIDWVATPSTLILKNWKDDCDSFAVCVSSILEDAGLLGSKKIITIIPTKLSNIKDAHVVADVTFKSAPDIHIILSSGYFYEILLGDYIKETYKYCGSNIMVLDYETGKEI